MFKTVLHAAISSHMLSNCKPPFHRPRVHDCVLHYEQYRAIITFLYHMLMLCKCTRHFHGEGVALETNGECTERESAGGVTDINRNPLIKSFYK